MSDEWGRSLLITHHSSLITLQLPPIGGCSFHGGVQSTVAMERAGGKNGKIALLVLYGIGVALLSMVGLWRQALVVRQLARWGVGDLGVTVGAARPAAGFQVMEVEPGSPAAGTLLPDDRVLRV